MLPPVPAEPLVVTASLTSGVARVTHGLAASVELIDEILALDHAEWESTLNVGDIEYHTSSDGPYPNNQMRVSVRPAARVAALHYADNDDTDLSMGYSLGLLRLPHEVYLVFNGDTGRVFPQSSIIPIVDARSALVEWLHTRRRPTCIQWQPFE